MMTFHVKPFPRTLALLSALLLPLGAAHADPDAQSILQQARLAQTGLQRTYAGHLRLQSTGKIIPFTLVLAGQTIRYQFKDDAVVLRLGQTGSQLMEAAHGDLRRVSPARYDAPVEGTDITYEDISLKFLYWPKARIDGSDTIDGLNCWKLILEPGAEPSAYPKVLLWVSKRTDAFLQGEGYDTSGALEKRFKVISGRPDPKGGWMLKSMRIETMHPGKSESVTYLEIDKELDQPPTAGPG